MSQREELLKTLRDNGGKVIDFPHGGGEQNARTAADELGIRQVLWTTSLSVPPLDVGRCPAPSGRSTRRCESGDRAKLAKFKVPKMTGHGERQLGRHDVIAVLREMKKEGKVRYIVCMSHSTAVPDRRSVREA